MLKFFFRKLFLYFFIFIFAVSMSVDAAAQQVVEPIYFIRTAEGTLVPSEHPHAVLPVTSTYNDNRRFIAPEPVPVWNDQETDWVTVAGVGLGLAVLVGAVVVGIDMSSGSSGTDGSVGNNDGGGTEDNSGVDTPGSGTETIKFKSPIRIGDDIDYNGTHDDNFIINTPDGIVYSESFALSDGFSSGTLKYTIAGAMEAAQIYMNGSLVGRSCNPGNTAYAKKECDPIDVTSQLKSGNNTLKISCVLYLPDNITPYDDIEIYDMCLVLER